MQHFSYLKDGETDATKRVLHATSKPGNISALDVSGLSEEDQTKACRLYDEWNETHVKAYNKLASAHKKEHLKSWEDFAKENGLTDVPMVKSFKPQGLTAV